MKVLKVEYYVACSHRMVFLRGLRMNKVLKKPYDFWEVGVEISHMHCMNQGGKVELKARQLVKVVISFLTLFICLCVCVFAYAI